MLGLVSTYIGQDLNIEKQRIYFNENIKQEIDIELTFILEDKLQRELLLAENHWRFIYWSVHF